MSDIDGVRKIEYVLMDAIGDVQRCVLHTVESRRVRGHNAEDVRPIRAAGNEQRLLKLPTKVAVTRS